MSERVAQMVFMMVFHMPMLVSFGLCVDPIIRYGRNLIADATLGRGRAQ